MSRVEKEEMRVQENIENINFSNNHFHQDGGMVHKKVMYAHPIVYISGQNLATYIC